MGSHKKSTMACFTGKKHKKTNPHSSKHNFDIKNQNDEKSSSSSSSPQTNNQKSTKSHQQPLLNFSEFSFQPKNFDQILDIDMQNLEVRSLSSISFDLDVMDQIIEKNHCDFKKQKEKRARFQKIDQIILEQGDLLKNRQNFDLSEFYGCG